MTEGLDDDVRHLFDLDVLVEVRDQRASRGVVEFGVTDGAGSLVQTCGGQGTQTGPANAPRQQPSPNDRRRAYPQCQQQAHAEQRTLEL